VSEAEVMVKNETKVSAQRRGIQIFVAAIVTALFLFLAFRNVNFNVLFLHLKRVDLRALGLFTMLFFGQALLRTERWAVQVKGVKGVRPAFFDALSINAVSFVAIFYIPFRLGEFVRPYLCERRNIMSAAAALSNSVLERVIDGLVTCGFLGAVLVLAPKDVLPKETIYGGAVALAIFGGASIVLALAFFFQTASVRFWSRLLTPLSKTLSQKLLHLLDQFLDGLGCFKNPLIFGRYLLTTVAYWLLNGYAMWILMRGLNIDVPLLVSYFTVCFLVIGVMIPAGPGAVGTFHYAASFALVLFGVSEDSAAAFAILIHAVQCVLLIVWAGLFLLFGGVRLKELKRA